MCCGTPCCRHWARCEPLLSEAAQTLEQGSVAATTFKVDRTLAPLPRAYQWVDGSAYVNHVELVRKARGAQMPASFWTDPLVYQGGSEHRQVGRERKCNVGRLGTLIHLDPSDPSTRRDARPSTPSPTSSATTATFALVPLTAHRVPLTVDE